MFLDIVDFSNTASASDFDLYLIPLGQARQFIEACGT
jgi:hypothetical protein